MLAIEDHMESLGAKLEKAGLSMTDDERACAQQLSRATAHAREPKDVREELIPPDQLNDLRERTDEAIEQYAHRARRLCTLNCI